MSVTRAGPPWRRVRSPGLRGRNRGLIGLLSALATVAVLASTMIPAAPSGPAAGLTPAGLGASPGSAARPGPSPDGAPAFNVTLLAVPSAGAYPLTVQFNVSATGGTFPYTAQFAFGDGSPNVTRTIHPATPYALAGHTYSSAGNFTASVNVTDAGGSSVTVTRLLRVGAPLTVTLLGSPNPATVGASASFVATPAGGLPPYLITWPTLPAACSAANASLQCVPRYSGNLTAKVRVADSVGDSAVASATVLVNVRLAMALARNVSFSCDNGGTVIGNYSANVTGGSPGLTFDWSFGDGSVSTSGPNVTHLYSLGSQYTASVLVTDSAGATVNSSWPVNALFPSCGVHSFVVSYAPPLSTAVVGVAGVASLLLAAAYLRRRDRGAATPYPADPSRGSGSVPSGAASDYPPAGSRSPPRPPPR